MTAGMIRDRLVVEIERGGRGHYFQALHFRRADNQWVYVSTENDSKPIAAGKRTQHPSDQSRPRPTDSIRGAPRPPSTTTPADPSSRFARTARLTRIDQPQPLGDSQAHRYNTTPVAHATDRAPYRCAQIRSATQFHPSRGICCKPDKIFSYSRLHFRKLASYSQAISLTTRDSPFQTRRTRRGRLTDGRGSAAEAALSTQSANHPYTGDRSSARIPRKMFCPCAPATLYPFSQPLRFRF